MEMKGDISASGQNIIPFSGSSTRRERQAGLDSRIESNFSGRKKDLFARILEIHKKCVGDRRGYCERK